MPKRIILNRDNKPVEEFYDEIIEGKCSCGAPVHKVTGSSWNTFTTGERYHYPTDNTAWGIIRCNNCKGFINETFIPND